MFNIPVSGQKPENRFLFACFLGKLIFTFQDFYKPLQFFFFLVVFYFSVGYPVNSYGYHMKNAPIPCPGVCKQ